MPKAVCIICQPIPKKYKNHVVENLIVKQK